MNKPHAPAGAKVRDTGRTLARDLAPGSRYGSTPDGSPILIKTIHELCATYPGPHVHLVLQGGTPKCLPFSKAV